jgi:hypothetical protein
MLQVEPQYTADGIILWAVIALIRSNNRIASITAVKNLQLITDTVNANASTFSTFESIYIPITSQYTISGTSSIGILVKIRDILRLHGIKSHVIKRILWKAVNTVIVPCTVPRKPV